MSRSNSLTNAGAEDVVIHTQVYRSRRRSGSGSKPSSRKNSLTEGAQEAYQPYDSHAYWQEQPVKGRPRRHSRGQNVVCGGYKDSPQREFSRQQSWGNDDDFCNTQPQRRNSGSQPSSRRNSGSQPYSGRNFESQPTRRRNSGSRPPPKKGSYSQPSSRRNSGNYDDVTYDENGYTNDAQRSSGAFFESGRGRIRTRRGSRKNSWEYRPREDSFDKIHGTKPESYYNDGYHKPHNKTSSRPGSRKNSLEKNVDIMGSHENLNTDMYHRSGFNCKPKARCNSLDNLHDTKRQYDHTVSDARPHVQYYTEFDHHRDNFHDTRKTKGHGSDSLDWRRDIRDSENPPSLQSNADSLEQNRPPCGDVKPQSEKVISQRRRQNNSESSPNQEIKQGCSEGSVTDDDIVRAGEKEPISVSVPNVSLNQTYQDASRSNALESFIYSAVKQLLIPKLGNMESAPQNSVSYGIDMPNDNEIGVNSSTATNYSGYEYPSSNNEQERNPGLDINTPQVFDHKPGISYQGPNQVADSSSLGMHNRRQPISHHGYPGQGYDPMPLGAQELNPAAASNHQWYNSVAMNNNPQVLGAMARRFRRSRSCDVERDSYSTRDGWCDTALTHHLPVFSQPAPNVNSLSSRLVSRLRPDEMINEPSITDPPQMPHRMGICADSNGLRERKECMYGNDGYDAQDGASLLLHNSGAVSKDYRQLQSWPPVYHDKYLYNATAGDSSYPQPTAAESMVMPLSAGNSTPQRDIVMNESDAGRREATEHSELNGPKNGVDEDEKGRVATEHCELETTAPAPAVLKRRVRSRRRRSRSKDYGLDPQYFPTLNRSAMLDENECPLDSLDLEASDWKECIEKCIENISTATNNKADVNANLESDYSSSGLSWGDEMEGYESKQAQKPVVTRSEDEKLQERFSAIRDRLFSPPVENTVSVISHHPSPVAEFKSISPLQVPEIRIDPPSPEGERDSIYPPKISQRRRRSRQFSGDLERSVSMPDGTGGVEPLKATGPVKLQRSLSLTSDMSYPVMHPPQYSRRTELIMPACGCDIKSPHSHEVTHYPSSSGSQSNRENYHDMPRSIRISKEGSTDLYNIQNAGSERGSLPAVQTDADLPPRSSSAFQPRVLRPRRRRARSQDIGIASHKPIIDTAELGASLARCDSMRDVCHGEEPSASESTADSYNDSINARFEQLLDTYLLGEDGAKPSGKIVRRKLKDKKKKPQRTRLKEDDKKEEVAATPEKERPVVINPRVDFTPGYFKEPLPVSRPVTNNVDARGARDSSASRPDSRASQEDEVIRKKNELNDAKSADSTDAPADAKETVIPTAVKPALQYDYKEDQWSPLNMEGKKAYDRQFLLQLQYAPDSVNKPAGLPNLPEVVLETIQQNRDTVMNSSRSHFNMSLDFTPGYVRQGSTPKGLPPKRNSQSRGGSRSKPPMVINIQREQVDLHRTKDAYKTFNKTEQSLDEDVSVIRQFRSILNKLTPQKFQTLIAQILQLPINTELRLKNTIDTIFEKALDEPGFSVAYANACLHLSKHFVVETEDKQKISFKKLLLNRCQQEFQKDKSDKTEFEAMEKEIEAATNEEKKKELKENLEFAIMKAKRRSLGNIRFIGELFKLQMLTEKIMHECVLSLVKSTDEESLECLCRLLSTIGKLLDVDKSKTRMDQYFQRIQAIVDKRQTSSRVRFMLTDTMDLRTSKWVPRRDESAPKTIEQIHKEAQEEKVEKALSNQRLAVEMNSRRSKDRSERGRPDVDGWQSVPAKANTIDPTKMRISKPQVVDDNIQLGPGGRNFGGWGRGSTGGGRNTSQEAERPQPTANRFSLLMNDDNKRGSGPPGMGRSPMGPPQSMGQRRSDSRDKRMGPGGGPRSMGSRPSKERDRGERESAMAAVRQLSGGSSSGRLTPGGGSSRNQSRESSRNRDQARNAPSPAPAPATAPPADLTPEQLERKTKAILDEYLQTHDLKEGVECVKELPASSLSQFVEISINHVLERSTQARQRTGTLMHDLVKGKVLEVQQYLVGLKGVLEFAEDMEIDIPKIWQYFGELIGPMVQDGSIALSFLKAVCEPIMHTGKAGKLVAEVLHDASHRLGHIKVGDIWRESLLSWQDFLTDSQDLKTFIKDHKLEFTVGEEIPHSPDGKGLSGAQVQTQLVRLLEQGVRDEEVFDWVEATVGQQNVKQHYFIRALTTAVCRSVINGTTVNNELLKKRCFILQRYLDHNGELELQALYALQALVTELQHPSGVLRRLFDSLYDEDVVSEDAFNQWEKSTDPAESSGKGVALSSVNQFFTWLHEAEEEEDQTNA